MGGVPPQPHPVASRHRDLADDPPTDVFPPVPAAADDDGPRGQAVGPADQEVHGAAQARRRAQGESRTYGQNHADGQGQGHSYGHGHGHGHTAAPPAGRRVKVLLAALLVPAALAALVGLVLLWPSGRAPTSQAATATPVHAQVVETHAARCDDASGAGAPTGAGGAGGDGSGCVALVVHMADGPRAGRDLVQLVPLEPSTPRFAVGDQVVLSWSGGDADDPGSYQVVDFQRSGSLWWLAGLFAAAVLALGRWRGLAALAALGLSFVVLLMFVLPAILAGHNPLWVAVVGACLIMFVVLYLTHGPSARTSTAVLGTLVSLLLIGGLSAAFTALARLTGLDDTTSALIGALGTGGSSIDARGLLLAGVVIGALGVLDDVTVTQTSAVWELHSANPALGARGLFAAANSAAIQPSAPPRW